MPRTSSNLFFYSFLLPCSSIVSELGSIVSVVCSLSSQPILRVVSRGTWRLSLKTRASCFIRGSKHLETMGAFHSTKNSEISDSKLNGTVKIQGKVFENLGIRFECTLFVGISGIIEILCSIRKRCRV